VYNGNVFVLINLDGLAEVPLLGDRMYVSDGLRHTVLIDFTPSR